MARFTITGFDHVQIAAPLGCEDAARHFFAALLGLEEIPKPPNLAKRGGVWFACGALQLHVGVEHVFAPVKKAHPAFHVQNLETLRQRLTAEGIAIDDGDPLPGFARFYVADPFGNRLEFLEPTEPG